MSNSPAIAVEKYRSASLKSFSGPKISCRSLITIIVVLALFDRKLISKQHYFKTHFCGRVNLTQVHCTAFGCLDVRDVSPWFHLLASHE